MVIFGEDEDDSSFVVTKLEQEYKKLSKTEYLAAGKEGAGRDLIIVSGIIIKAQLLNTLEYPYQHREEAEMM